MSDEDLIEKVKRLSAKENSSENSDSNSEMKINYLIKGGEVNKKQLKALLTGHIECTVNILTGIGEVTREFEEEWFDYILMWNCARDQDHGDYMGKDVRDMLIRYNVNLTYELNQIDLKIYSEVFKEAVTETENLIRSYWELKNQIVT